jgi:hypothetical protein
LPAAHEELESRLRFQAKGCAELGSPFYAALLEAAADDLKSEGPVWELLAEFEAEPEWSALALRMMAAIHRLVLQDRLTQLSPHYPSVGGDGDAATAWPLFRSALTDHRAELRRLIGRGCQTNEVGRSAALLGDSSRSPIAHACRCASWRSAPARVST